MPAVISLQNVRVRLGDLIALDIERLEMGQAERAFVLGHSGAGKTTLSRLIKSRLRPIAGTVRILGCEPGAASPAQLRSLERRVAMIDQEFHLVPRHSVASNVLHGCLGRVSVGRSLLGWYPRAEWSKAEDILREVGLERLGDRRVDTLSGGQRQRAAIARALMQDAEIILADEPISNLDPELAEDALELLVACAARRGVTLLVNLHQPALARRFASRVIGLANGKVVFDGPPERFSSEQAEAVYGEASRRPPQPDQESHDLATESMEKKAHRPDIRLARR